MTRIALLLVALNAAALVAQDAPNPFFKAWTGPFGTPPFAEIKEEHFLPAFKEGMAKQKAAIQAIVDAKEPPTFANTIEAMDATGAALEPVSLVFGALSGAETNPKLQAINRDLAPLRSRHQDDIAFNEGLWKRVKQVYDDRAKAKLSPEQAKLLESRYKGFVRAGALLGPDQKTRMRAINEELSQLGVKYADRLLKATKDFRLVVEKAEDLQGLPPNQLEAAAQAAKKAGLAGKWLFTLDGPSIWPFLQFAENRDLRQKLLTGYLDRCRSGETDTRPLLAKIAALRVEKARLLGYASWADFVLEENMAKNPSGVYGLLKPVWQAALAKAKVEREEIRALMAKELPGAKLEPWDWRFYQERVRKAKYDLDEEALKPYFSIDRVREGAFLVATKLYGITFAERKDVPVYHPEVRVFEVKEKDGRHVGLLYTDYHPRPGKRGGAWCGSLRPAREGHKVTPLVTNVCNFTRPAGDAPALLTPDETRTLFHEFGHALANLFYMGQYRGGGRAQDYVELPSQIMENWAMEPEVLKVYARHHKTGAPIPEALAAKIKKSRSFGEGFATTEYMAAALLDMDWHTLAEPKEVDPDAFEKASLEKWGLIPEIPSRYRSPYFQHIFGPGGGYSAGYYSYIWSAVLDSDAFMAFKEKGDLFHPATAAAFRKLLEKGQTIEPAEIYRGFRGRDPKPEALLAKRGLK
ncbi:MAG: M3 family metallopeptidase [Acidobacteria bacterium]|nr:M3 family metallopeptidase [Acidobacteriota bacterium]